MRTEKKITIGGFEYTIHHFGASEGLKLGLELGRLVAPVIAPLVEMADAADEGEAAALITPELAERAAKAVVEHMDPDATVGLVQRLVARTTCMAGVLESPAVFESHFAGRLGDLVPLLKAIVEHNFADFFSGLASKAAARAKKKSTK